MHKHTITSSTLISEALIKLDKLAADAILFLVDEHFTLIGSLTDGDLRRGFIKGYDFNTPITNFVQPNPSYLFQDENAIQKLELYKAKNFKIIPVLNKEKQIVDIVNFRHITTILPLDTVVMAGGKGIRLRPLTEITPKPLLKVGDKPIIEHNIDRLIKVGIKNFHLSINYLGEQIQEYFGDGSKKGITIDYVKEDKPLGTIGSILLINSFKHEEILVMNSDLLTNIDYADFYKLFKDTNADMAVAATPYRVDIPYSVLEVESGNLVKSLKEKPSYSFHVNAGIYLLKKELLKMIPKDTLYNITDLMDKVIKMNLKLVTYPINGYWLDIGKPEDFKKAQNDIKHIKF